MSLLLIILLVVLVLGGGGGLYYGRGAGWGNGAYFPLGTVLLILLVLWLLHVI